VYGERVKNPLLDIIKQSPMVYRGNPKCPYCNSELVKVLRSSATLVGGRWLKNGDHDDPNHYTSDCDCFGCNKRFYWEYRRGMEWYQDMDGNMLKGVHNCFEECVYDCKCGGKVHRRYTELDGLTEVKHGLRKTLVEGRGYVNQYCTFWKCDSCSKEVEIK
jgi:hypothetical protein